MSSNSCEWLMHVKRDFSTAEQKTTVPLHYDVIELEWLQLHIGSLQVHLDNVQKLNFVINTISCVNFLISSLLMLNALVALCFVIAL